MCRGLSCCLVDTFCGGLLHVVVVNAAQVMLVVLPALWMGILSSTQYSLIATHDPQYPLLAGTLLAVILLCCILCLELVMMRHSLPCHCNRWNG